MEISGDAMLAKVKEYAEELKLTNFSASRGYLANFKNRYGIKFKKLHGEGGTLSMEIVDSWTIVLRSVIESYRPEDIYNWDETELFYTQTKNASHITAQESNDSNMRGKKESKQRLTILVEASLAGKKLPLIMIDKSAKPRAFRNVNHLPVKYYSQGKAWMNSEIFVDKNVK